MSEFSDWGGWGFAADPQSDASTSPAGGGGDPYGGGDYSGVGDIDFEALSTGVLPGGSDGQYGPFSPNQGLDFTDILKGGGAISKLATQPLFGGGGSVINTSPTYSVDRLPNLGTSPMVRARGQAVALDATSSAGDIVRYVRQSSGLRVTARSIVNLIVRYGFPAAARLTALDFGSLLKLFMRQKGVTHHRRGPGLYTVARKLRSADRLRATAARILGRGGGHRRRPGRGRFRIMRRRSRHHAR